MKVCSICHRCYDDTVASCAESEHPELSAARVGSVQIIAGYSLDMMLEPGIKGETYRARRTDSDLPCLIKISAANEEYTQQFLRDAKNAATLFDQNVVDVYETGSLESGEVFIVAEEPAGQTARDLLNNVGVPQLLTTVQVVRQAAEAVHALHLSGLIHRAVRPENIVLTTDAEHRLLVRIQNVDLGGVAEHAIVSNKFLIDSALDSLRYFAPEQFTGEGASAKSDVYSLGIVLYEMLAGAPPFDAEKASGLIEMHRNQRPSDVQIDNFDLRMLLTHTLMESLQKEPAKRQPSANAFARQLRHIEQLATHSPTPPAAGTVPAAPPRTNAAAGTAAAAKLAPVIETPRAVNIAETHRVDVKADSELLAVAAVPKLAAAFQPEPDPSFQVPYEIEAAPRLALEAAGEQAEEQANLVLEQPTAATEKADSEPPKSRLKRLKKQLRSFTAPAAAAASAEPSTPPVIEQGSGMTSAGVTPRKIELEQPVDNIPSSDSNDSPDETLWARSTAQSQQEVPVVTAALAAVAAAPRKIEWEQPDDDIPSLDDIPEALFSEPMPAGPVVPEPQVVAPRSPVSSVPRKIEWEQPEDDIPCLGDVSEALLIEPIAAKPMGPEPQLTSAPVSSVPRKIEWEQPEDDIPSMKDVVLVLSEEPMMEAPIVEPVMGDVAPAQLDIAPRRIEWVQPEDDIPSLEEAMEVLAREGSALEVPIIEPQPAESVSVAASYSKRAANATVSPIVVPVRAEVQSADEIANFERGSAVQTVNVISVAEPEPEDITLVSPPRRITVDWEKPRPWETLSKEIEFFPTLLGDVDARRKADPHSEPFFSTYYDEAEPRSADHYRSLMIGSGFVVLIVLFLFGNDSVWKYFQGGNAADSVAVQTTSVKPTFPQPGQTTTPNEQGKEKNFEKPKSGDEVESGQSKPSPIRVSGATSEKIVSDPADRPLEQNKQKQAKSSERSAGKTPLVPSTLVISSDDGKISSKVEPQKRKSTESTRPRIVENANP